ncbi:hypothetical protein ACIA5D_50650 [Actinoplanes sp. NPDC051513]|uniref:hypothetical protein n=1 Tax=Actinoplanes sp. NPDC051513 TaxID=3363908 RepID=UPI0037A6B477
MTTAASTRTAGLLCPGAAAIGAAGGPTMIMVAPQVGPDRLSCPFDTPMHLTAQIVFVINHVLLLIGVVAVGRAVLNASRAGKAGIGIAAAALIGLTLCEIGAMTLARAQVNDARVDRLNIGYGGSSLAIGFGLVVAGIAVIRAGRWQRWARYTVPVCGLALFAAVVPAKSGPMAAGRLALIAWMAM